MLSTAKCYIWLMDILFGLDTRPQRLFVYCIVTPAAADFSVEIQQTNKKYTSTVVFKGVWVKTHLNNLNFTSGRSSLSATQLIESINQL